MCIRLRGLVTTMLDTDADVTGEERGGGRGRNA